MRWLNKLHDVFAPDEPPSVSDETKNIYDSAKTALDDAKKRQIEVRQVSAEAYGLRERNHFGESFQRAMARKERPA